MWALIFIGLGTFFGWNQMKSLKIGFAVYFILIFLVAIYFYTMDTSCDIILTIPMSDEDYEAINSIPSQPIY